jgi:hypothetical protein
MATIAAPQPLAPTATWSDIPETTSVTASVEELAAAFTEWERRFREEPERFQSEAARLLRDTPETYGDACAPYLAWILGQNGQGR